MPPDPSRSNEFPGSVPDFLYWDWGLVKPRPTPADRRGRGRRTRPRSLGSAHALCVLAIRQQGSTCFDLPDALLAACRWGVRENWPRGWRQKLERAYGYRAGLRACPPGCPMAGRGTPHLHASFQADEPFLGAMSAFFGPADPDGCRRLDPDIQLPTVREAREARRELKQQQAELWHPCLAEAERRVEELERRSALRKGGTLSAIYWPIRVFGDSPRLGLSPRPRDLLVALTHELTRDPASRRADKAEVVVGGVQRTNPEGYPVPACPYLAQGVRHVGFNGNGTRRKAGYHGRGYTLFGYRDSGKGWLGRCGYLVGEEDRWDAVGGFLADLARLSRPFGLVVAGRAGRDWRDAAGLAEATRTPEGRRWLRRCTLRAYTAEDYLPRWRQVFADALGFSHIPHEPEPPPGGPADTDGGPRGPSGSALISWMDREGLTQAAAARRLGVSRSTIGNVVAGIRAPSPDLLRRLAADAGPPAGDSGPEGARS